jgi:hypothetical protein
LIFQVFNINILVGKKFNLYYLNSTAEVFVGRYSTAQQSLAINSCGVKLAAVNSEVHVPS